jgi:Asp/Glu/hydantoin racemase
MPRIVLIHAMHPSMAPARAAFAAWPGAELVDLLDDSLARDVVPAGVTPAIIERFLALARYAQGIGAAGILFTCSAFGAAIEACQRELAIPVLKPNEAALEDALAAGPRVALVATFPATIDSMGPELEALAAARGVKPTIATSVIAGAIDALNAGRAEEHDRLIVEAVARLGACDAIVLAQFSMARAAAAIAPRAGRIITTPGSAVAKLRRILEERQRRR